MTQLSVSDLQLVFVDSVALLPAVGVGSRALRAMEYTNQLPAGIDKKAWKAAGWDAERCARHARSQASRDRSLNRTRQPEGEARMLLTELRESGAFWLALRKHLDEEEALFILKVLQEHSGWREVKKSRNEELRKEYLRLYDECRYFDPDWRHKEMRERRIAADREAEGQEF